MRRPVLAVALVAWLAPSLAWAGPVELHTSTNGPTEVGGDVDVTLSVSSPDDPPSDPQLSVPRGLSVVGTTMMPSQQITVVNGVMSASRGLNVTFVVHTTQAGLFNVTPSVKVGGKRVSAPAATVKVVPMGTLPKRPQGFNPFDPFGFFNNGQDPFGGQEPEPPQLLVDPKLGLAAPRGQGSFLHATVDKSRAVLGEQVTLTVYLYLDTQTREPDFTDAHEATANDFVRKPLMKDDGQTEDAGYAAVGGRTYSVRVLRRVALFPIKTGDLEIGPMSLSIAPKGGSRESERLSVMVVDAPVAGRPAGYEAGNVGRYMLTADVDPRTTERGSVVSVNVTLSGTGNLPSELPVPLQAGVKWLEPEIREKLTTASGRAGGERTFSYVVRTEREGDVDLGAIELPFYDADAHRYDVARAALGTVHVTHSDAAPAESSGPTLGELPQLRRSLAVTSTHAKRWSDRPLAWALLFFAPLSFVFVSGSRAVMRRARARAAEQKSSPAALLKDKERAQAAALLGDDAGAIDAATIRVLEGAVLAHLGKNLRAATGSALVRELEEAGAGPETAAKLRTLLGACEAARFAPDGASTKDARGRAQEARDLVRAIAKGKP